MTGEDQLKYIIDRDQVISNLTIFLTNEQIAIFAKALAANTTLKSVTIKSNKSITTSSIQAIEAAKSENSNLKIYLMIDFN